MFHMFFSLSICSPQQQIIVRTCKPGQPLFPVYAVNLWVNQSEGDPGSTREDGLIPKKRLRTVVIVVLTRSLARSSRHLDCVGVM